jgi:hypothetical protein
VRLRPNLAEQTHDMWMGEGTQELREGTGEDRHQATQNPNSGPPTRGLWDCLLPLSLWSCEGRTPLGPEGHRCGSERKRNGGPQTHGEEFKEIQDALPLPRPTRVQHRGLCRQTAGVGAVTDYPCGPDYLCEMGVKSTHVTLDPAAGGGREVCGYTYFIHLYLIFLTEKHFVSDSLTDQCKHIP